MRPLHHIGYWVDDLDSAVERAVRTLGVGPFLVDRNIRFDSFTLPDGTSITDPDYLDHTAAFASWGPVVLELGEVHAAHPDIVAAYGIRTGHVGHVSWLADDLELESERLEALGCPLIHTATLGAVSVAWHSGGPLFPHPIEVHRAGAAILGMAGRLAALADGWDGSRPMRPMQPTEQVRR